MTQVKQIQSEMVNITTKEINIPSKNHNTVIGTGGKLIQTIMSEYGEVSCMSHFRLDEWILFIICT